MRLQTNRCLANKSLVVEAINMAKHEFGMMDKAPTMVQEFNDYEPQKYHCIAVDDCYIEPLTSELSTIQCYWHTLKREEHGLAYWGVTIIPPNSLREFISVLGEKSQFDELRELLQKAVKENKYIIHYGI
jgi:hypothetical protein